MTSSRPSDLSTLSPQELLALAQQVLNRPGRIEARRCLGVAIVWLIFGVILLVLGSLCLANFAMVTPALLIGLGMLLGGLWNLVSGLIGVVDRSPVLTLDAEMLIDHRSDRRYPWSAIRKASLYRTTRNGSETSATLTLTLSEFLIDGEVRIDVANLDVGSSEILRIIGQRANLQ